MAAGDNATGCVDETIDSSGWVVPERGRAYLEEALMTFRPVALCALVPLILSACGSSSNGVGTTAQAGGNGGGQNGQGSGGSAQAGGGISGGGAGTVGGGGGTIAGG